MGACSSQPDPEPVMNPGGDGDDNTDLAHIPDAKGNPASNNADAAKTDGKKTDENLAEEVKQNIRRQRRRLSVTPAHVGNMKGLLSVDKEEPPDLDNTATEKIPKGRSIVCSLNRHAKVSALYSSDAKNVDGSYVCITKKGYVPYNKDKINQDSFIADATKYLLFGVLDGHGEAGEQVSELCADRFPKSLTANLEAIQEDPTDEKIIKSIQESCKSCAEDLQWAVDIDTAFSGTTFVASYINRETKKIYTANIGDSRGVVVREVEGKLTCIPLSEDHKPDLPKERERIEATGGRIAPLPGPPGVDMGPMRVWLKDVEVPGLAMSRSFGDQIAHRAGVTDDPEIKIYDITPEDYFVIWASDGVWEFLENEDVANVIYRDIMQPEIAVSNLVKTAVNKWCAAEDAVDDITAVIYMLRKPTDPILN